VNDDYWIIVDTETDGISQPIHIVEIGAQLMRGWEPYGEPFRVLLNHNVPIPPEVVAIHGYTREFLCKHGRDPREAHVEFRQYVRGLPIVAHNLSFDWNRCLVAEWQRLHLEPAGTRGFCTLMLARRVVFETRKFRLDALRDHFDLEVLKSHRALNDVKTLVELAYRVFGPRLESVGIRGFDDVRHFSTRTPVANCLNLIKSSQIQRKSITPVVPAKPSKPIIPLVPPVPATFPSRLQPTLPSLPAVKSLPTTQRPPASSQSFDSKAPAGSLVGKFAFRMRIKLLWALAIVIAVIGIAFILIEFVSGDF
jgi:DNA polymerase III epsilon subunit-like protein